MQIDPYRVLVFLHVVLFAYWLGADLGVFICGMGLRRPDISAEDRRGLAHAGALIDMAPRSCLVLMAPVGLTLAVRYGSPLRGAPLALVWVAALAWLWLVWQVHWKQDEPFGKRLWRMDLAVRGLVMTAFVAFGAWCLISGAPISAHWLGAKILLFGLIILAGIIVRLLLIAPSKAAPASVVRRHLRQVVFLIWGLVALIAFIGVVKPF